MRGQVHAQHLVNELYSRITYGLIMNIFLRPSSGVT